MRIWCTGKSGMLGRQVCELIVKDSNHLLIATDSNIDIANRTAVEKVVQQDRPDVVINCAGKRDGPAALMLAANSVGPHVLASFGVPMIHMSTDCVFSGRAGNDHWYSSNDRRLPDPDTLYGRSKLAGEVLAPHVVNVRGSFIGVDHGFLRWLLDARGVINVWKNAYWNGTTAIEMATQLLGLALLQGGGGPNVVHVASDTCISKAAMAKKIVEGLELDVSLNIVDEPRVRRVLLPDITLEPIGEMLDKLIAA